MKDKQSESVLFIIDTLDGGGAERVVVELAKALKTSRFTPVVCTTRNRGIYANELVEQGIELFCLSRKRRYDIKGFFKLLKLLYRIKPKIVHTHMVGSNNLGRIAAILLRVPNIIAHEHAMPDRSVQQRVLDSILALKTRYIIACGEAVREALLKMEFLKRDKVIVVHNGIRLDNYGNGLEVIRTKTEMHLLSKKIVGCIARLEPRKDIRNLLESATFVLERIPNAFFVIAGDGAQRKELEQLACKLGIEDDISFLGFRTDIQRLLGIFDVFVLPSKSEGLPLVVLEAMAACKPVISTNVGSLPEVIIDGFNGILVPPESPEELGKEIASLLEDTEKAATISRNGRLILEKEYSIQVMAKRLEKIYSNVIDMDSS